jgi:hypothetical protein
MNKSKIRLLWTLVARTRIRFGVGVGIERQIRVVRRASSFGSGQGRRYYGASPYLM